MPSLAFLGQLVKSAAAVTARRRGRGPLRPTWSWGFEVVAHAMKTHAAKIGQHDWPTQRRLWDAQSAPSPVFREVEREPTELAGVRGEWFVPKHGAAKAVVLYLHGGSFIYGSMKTHGEAIARLALAASARVFALDYRLAPEHPFPAQLDDALGAYRALRARGHERVVIAGDSAGGNLAIMLALALTDDPPAGAVLFSPWVDLAARGGSLESNAPYDYAEPENFQRWAAAYLGGVAPDDPRASPLYADLSKLPPSLVVVGTAEMLLDQVRAFVDRGRAAGAAIEVFEDPDMIHDGIVFAGLFARCREAERRAGAFVQRVTT